MNYEEIYNQEEKDIEKAINSLEKYIDKEKELVQYIIINKDLNMSPGKIAAQVGHVCTLCAMHILEYKEWEWEKYQIFKEWFNKDQKKIILEAHQKVLEKLENQFYSIRDNGLTEIPSNSLTAVSLGVMTRKEAEPYVKRLQLLK